MKTPGKWVRLARDLYRNRKIMALAHNRQKGAIATYCLSLAWCGDNGTDGWLPAYALPVIFGTAAEAAALCCVGLWVEAEGGWEVHDWPLWQESNEHTRAKSERARDAANTRWTGREAMQNAMQNAMRNA